MLRFIIIALTTCPLPALGQYAEDEFCSQLAYMERLSEEHLEEFTELSEQWPDKNTKLLSNGEFNGKDIFPDDWAIHSLHAQIASCYITGKGTARNIIKAMALLQDPAQASFFGAAHILASIRLFKTDDPKLHRLGFIALEQEYEAGSAFAAGKLGWAYQKGLGVDPNQAKALELYEYAARSGMTYWQYLLAHAYEKGYLGLDVDPDRAARWLDFKPRVHVARYECWVASYYADGTFPANEELQAKYRNVCEETSVSSGVRR